MGRNIYLASKRVFDVVASLSALLVLSPLLAMLAICVKLSAPGSVICRRKCVSKNGFYDVYTFRTTADGATYLPKHPAPSPIDEYSRVTGTGKLLRKTSLDEIPQLINVFKGEMSLVGPRPVAADETGLYGSSLDEVLSVRPGMTGYWRTHSRDIGKRRELELYYARHQSFLLDMWILARTFVILIARLLGLCWETLTRGMVYRAMKFLADKAVSAVMLVILSPLFLMVAAAIKREDGGDVLHRRQCVGKGGKTFTMYKFRSMFMDADDYEKYFSGEELERYLSGEKTTNDPRITRVGKFMRRTSIDELPQLISVLMGNMSLVGPRPVTAREAEFYGDMKPFLLSVRPGITGWWQVNGRDDVAYLTEETKSLQLYYVSNQSLMLDIKILLMTIVVVLKKEGAK